MKKLAIACLVAFAATLSAQTDNTLHATQFPGNDVGTKVTNALAACNPSGTIPCYIIIDPSLAAYATGTIPTPAANQHIIDYRTNPFSGGSSSTANASIFSTRTTYSLSPSAFTAVSAEGTSITCGVGGLNTGACSSAGFVNTLATYLGVASPSNHGIAGASTCKIAWAAFAYENPSASDGVFRTLEFGMNERGVAPPLMWEELQQCGAAAITWETSPLSTKYLESSFGTLPTNWYADTTTIPGLTVLSTTTNAAPAVYQCTGVATNNNAAPYGYCFVWFAHLDANSAGNGAAGAGAYISYKMDSGTLSYLPLSTAPTTGVGAPSSTAYGTVDVIAIPMTASGTHTITITPNLNSGDVATIIGTGTNPSTPADPLWVLGVPYALNDQYEPTLAQVYDQTKTLTQTAQSYGLNAYFVATRNCMLGNLSEMYTGDGLFVHPGPTGHGEIATCVEQAQQTTPASPAVPNPTLLGSFRSIAGNGPYNITVADQVVNVAPTANAYAYLPAMPNSFAGLKYITVVNTATANTLTVGGNYMSGAPIATIYPNGVATFYNQGGVKWFVSTMTPGGSNALAGGCEIESSSFALNAFNQTGDCNFLNSSSAGVVTLPSTTQIGKVWYFINNGTGTWTFTGAANGNANSLTLASGQGAILASGYANYINILSTSGSGLNVPTGTQWGIPYYSASGTIGATAAPTVNNAALLGSTSGAPTWGTIALPTTATQYGLVYASTSTALSTTAALTANALIRASTSGGPTASTVLDNATDVVTTEPLYSANGNQLNGTAANSITATTPTSTGIGFPATYATTARTYRGFCHISWEQATAVATVQFSVASNAAPTHMSLTSVSYPGTTAVPYGTGTTDITTATTTSATPSLTPAATATPYVTDIYVALSAAAAANTLTLNGLTSNASDALLIEPGSFCTWLP